VLLAFPFCGLAAEGGEVHIAVSANFAGTLQMLAAEFTKDTGHHVQIVSGATGTLYAQIQNGAPVDILLAADEDAPRKLEAEGQGVAGTRFTYALGRLVLWSARPGFVDAAGDVLRNGHFQHLAIANPRVAPYGHAAMETLASLGLVDATRSKLVQGENVGQTAQFVSTGAAELGFVALSQVGAPGAPSTGSFWRVPERLYSPIRQDAVLLKRGAPNGAARDFIAYLQSRKARDRIQSSGYGVDAPAAGAPASPPPTAPAPSPAIPRSSPGGP
jgi:molybdate transport system substrate-binding protein